MNGKIYCIRNNVNGKMYIGQTTKSIKERLSHHRSDASGCTAIKSAIKKYGFSKFTVSIIDIGISSYDELNCAEEFYIWMYRSLSPHGYNLTTGGNNFEMTDIFRQRLSDINTGKKHSKKTKDKLKKIVKEKFRDDMYRKEHSDKIRNAWKDPEKRIVLLCGLSKIPKEKRIEIAKNAGKKSSEKRCYPVMCIETGVIYKTKREASIALGIYETNIGRSVFYGNSAKGLHFIHVDKCNNKQFMLPI